MLPGTDLSTALPVQSCGISGGEFRKLTLGGRNLEGPEIERVGSSELLNPNSLPKRGMRGTRPRMLDVEPLSIFVSEYLSVHSNLTLHEV